MLKTMLKNFTFILVFSLTFISLSCKENEPDPKSSSKAITKFSFSKLTPAVQGVIDEASKKIAVQVPSNTDLTKLIPSISISPKAKVSPDSGAVQNFTNEVVYKVTAEDGSTTDYKITVSRGKSSGKDILEMRFLDFNPSILANIDPVKKTITATVPATTDLTKLKPTLILSTSSKASPASETLVDFSKSVNFVVTAEDGSSQTYLVTVSKEILSLTNLPKTITYSSLPTQLNNNVSVKYTWNSNGVLTNMIETISNNITESAFTRDKDGFITKIDVVTNGVKSTNEYSYSADKKTVTLGKTGDKEITVWQYNDRNLLTRRTIKNTSSNTERVLNLTWFGDRELVNTVNDSKSLCTITGWGTAINPLWEISKQTQFLFINDSNYPTSVLYLSQRIINPWELKSLANSSKNQITTTIKEDVQKRITNIIVQQDANIAQGMNFTY
jgi:hypothetical protein